MQHVQLDPEPETFYCPVTGELIHNSEMFEASPATVFTVLPEADDFDMRSPGMQEIFDSLQVDEDDFPDDIFEKFKQKVTDQSVVCFSIVSRGMACGPTASVVHIGIDMSYATASE